MNEEDRPALYGATKEELEAIVEERGMPRYTAAQLCDWLYKKHAASFEEMTNISKRHRARLAEEFVVGRRGHSDVSVATDGTKKYLYTVTIPPQVARRDGGVQWSGGATRDGGTPEGRASGAPPKNPRGPRRDGGVTGQGLQRHVEAAYIPEARRHTLCLSTQVGCKMGCLFCMTARQGFQGHLSAGDVVNQLAGLPERDQITNLVYMGMGEPLDNLEAVLKSLRILTEPWGFGMSPNRITVSTIGVVPAMRTLLEKTSVHLAVSLHSPFEEERRRLMPIENVYSLHEVLGAIRATQLDKRRRISFEYIVFRGLNHSDRHVKEIARLVGDMRCRINLLYFHPIPGAPLEPASEKEMLTFQDSLKQKGLRVTVRKSRGQDIEAACGMLSTKRLDAAEMHAEAVPEY